MRVWKFWKKPRTKAPQQVKHLPRDIRLDQVERMMGGLPAQREHPSMLFFTVHKAASSFVGGMLMRLAIAQQINHIDYEEYLNSERTDYAQQIPRQILESVMLNTRCADAQPDGDAVNRKAFELSRLFPKTGFHFGPIRSPRLLAELPDLDRYLILVQLRDPRDCITSMYFSKAYSHVAPRHPGLLKRFLEDRRQVQEASIDEFVLKNATQWVNVYRQYAQAVRNLPHLQLVKYEEMVLDFPAWLDKVERAWNLQIDPATRQQLIDQTDFNVEQEDVTTHKRQVLPGDHVRKLEPGTVRQLTDMFGPVLESLGYPPEVKYSRAA